MVAVGVASTADIVGGVKRIGRILRVPVHRLQRHTILERVVPYPAYRQRYGY